MGSEEFWSDIGGGDESVANESEEEFGDDGDDHAESEGIESGIGSVSEVSVEDLDDVEGRSESEDIDEEGGHDDVGKHEWLSGESFEDIVHGMRCLGVGG